MLAEYFELSDVPDHSVLCKKNSSKRWLLLWKRFFSFVLESMPQRSVVAATDASGFSGRKRSWRETDHAVKAMENWVKIHAVIEVDSFVVLNYELTPSNLHDSQMFSNVWDRLPKNVHQNGASPTPLITARSAWQRPDNMERRRSTGSRRTRDTSLDQKRCIRRWYLSGSTGRTGQRSCTARETMLKRRSA